MLTFATIREAKEFLVGRIVDEARRTGTPLSDVEEKMMYFSETGWTLEGMYELNAVFEAEYDQGEYEEKIARLIRKLTAAERSDSEAVRSWRAAEALLRTEGHYLLVLIDLAGGRTSLLKDRGPSNRLAWVMIYGLAGFVVCAAAFYVSMLIFNR
jgi:hypothetical protein